MIIRIAFSDRYDLVYFNAGVVKGSGDSFDPCPFDSELLDKVKSLKGFKEVNRGTNAGEEFCCAFSVPRSSFESVDSIRALFEGYTEVKVERNENYVQYKDAKVFEFTLVLPKEAREQWELQEYQHQKKTKKTYQRSDELMTERFNEGKAPSP